MLGIQFPPSMSDFDDQCACKVRESKIQIERTIHAGYDGSGEVDVGAAEPRVIEDTAGDMVTKDWDYLLLRA